MGMKMREESRMLLENWLDNAANYSEGKRQLLRDSRFSVRHCEFEASEQYLRRGMCFWNYWLRFGLLIKISSFFFCDIGDNLRIKTTTKLASQN